MAPKLLLELGGLLLLEEGRETSCAGLPRALEPADEVSPEEEEASPRAWMSTALCSSAASGLLCDDLDTKYVTSR